MLTQFIDARETIEQYYEADDTSKAVREITRLADLANQYIAHHAPWQLIKQEDQRDRVQRVCSMGINLFRLLVIYLKPILPKMAVGAETFLGVQPLVWSDLDAQLLGHAIEPYKPLFTRIDRATVDKLIDASAVADESDADAEAKTDAQTNEPAESPDISIDDFVRIELKVAKIVNAELVEGADKLLRLTLDVGSEQREVLSGIRHSYTPEQLIGQLTVVVANLAPRKMRFGVSEGMVLAASGDGSSGGGDEIFLIKPDTGAGPGMIVS